MTKYQITKTKVIDANRQKRSLEGKFADQFLVAVNPVNTNGNFSHEPLKQRGYTFGGKNMSVVGKIWFKSFTKLADADAEVEALCEVGI